MQVINDPFRTSAGGAGYLAGAGVQRGLNSIADTLTSVAGGHLTNLLNTKLQQRIDKSNAQQEAQKYQQQVQQWEQLGVPSHFAQIIPGLQPAAQAQVFQDIHGNQGMPEQQLQQQSLPTPQVAQLLGQQLQNPISTNLGNLFNPAAAVAPQLTQAIQQKQQQQQTAQPQQKPNQFQQAATQQQEQQANLTPYQKAQQNKAKAIKDGEEKPTPRELKEVKAARSAAVETQKYLDRMDELLATGKVNTGLLGQLPTYLQNAETRRFDQLSKKVALFEASKIPGILTNAKLRVALASKPNLDLDIESNREAIQDVRDKVKSTLDEADELLGTKKETKDESRKESNTIKKLTHQLPPDQYAGKRAIDDESGEYYRSNGKEWVKE